MWFCGLFSKGKYTDVQGLKAVLQCRVGMVVLQNNLGTKSLHFRT